MDCGLWCVLSERRRHVEKLWRRRLLITSDERRARRRFLRLMRGFDAEDVDVLRRAVESGGADAKQCAPGPPMDERPEEEPQEAELEQEFDLESPSSSGIQLHDTPSQFPPQEEDSGLIPQIDRPMSMPYLCCKLWRWKDLQVDAALHRLEALPWCRFGRVTINNATVSCCNPYHYALWIRPEVSSQEDDEHENNNAIGLGHSNTIVPPVHSIGNGHLGTKPSTFTPDTGLGDSFPLGPPPSLPPGTPPEHLLLDTLGSQPGTSQGSPQMVHQQAVGYKHHHLDYGSLGISTLLGASGFLVKLNDGRLVPAWARLDRWERRERIGDSVPLTGQFAAIGLLTHSVHDAQNVIHDFDTKNEVSFALIRQSDPIGSENPEDVWLYNSGTRPLFICVSSSPGGSSRPDTLRRLTPGYCVRVHKGQVPVEEGSERELRRLSRDPASMTSHLIISVGKGWGPNYHRLFVTDTPIRYEVTFAP